jgi:hypothetical protein
VIRSFRSIPQREVEEGQGGVHDVDAELTRDAGDRNKEIYSRQRHYEDAIKE